MISGNRWRVIAELSSVARLLINAVHELYASADQGQESGAVQLSPALLGHVEQLECHEQAFGSRAGALGHALAQAHRSEG